MRSHLASRLHSELCALGASLGRVEELVDQLPAAPEEPARTVLEARADLQEAIRDQREFLADWESRGTMAELALAERKVSAAIDALIAAAKGPQ